MCRRRRLCSGLAMQRADIGGFDSSQAMQRVDEGDSAAWVTRDRWPPPPNGGRRMGGVRATPYNYPHKNSPRLNLEGLSLMGKFGGG